MKKLVLLACVAAIACGDDDSNPADGGMDANMEAGADMTVNPDMTVDPDMTVNPDMTVDPDMMTPDEGMPDMGMGTGICAPDALEAIAAMDDGTVSVTVDTSAATATPESLGEDCGNPDVDPLRQIVLAITIPGDGARLVSVTTDNAGTEVADTILQLRADDCATIGGPETCFDDISFSPGAPDNNFLSTATFTADGGSTVFVVVTGFPATDVVNEGNVEVSITVEAPAAPVLDTVAETVVVDATDAVSTITTTLAGSDANGDVAGWRAQFLDDAGDVITLDGEDTFELAFDEDLSGDTTFDAVATENVPSLPAEAVTIRATVFDAAGLESDPVEAALSREATVCDDGETIAVTASISEIVTQTVDTTSITAANIPLSCGGTIRNQAVFAVTIPADATDRVLTVSTDNAGTMIADTVLELRTTCNAPSAAGCNDDIGGGNLRSASSIAVEPDDVVFAIVDGFGADDVGVAEVSFELVANEAPVLDTMTADKFALDDETDQIGITMTGSDADANIAGYIVEFIDAAGDVVDVDGDGTADTFNVGFPDTVDLTMTDLDAFVAPTIPTLPDAVVSIRIRLVDEFGVESDAITAMLGDGMYVGVDGDCSAATALCEPALACTADVCVEPSAPVLTELNARAFPIDGGDSLLALQIVGTDTDGDIVSFSGELFDGDGASVATFGPFGTTDTDGETSIDIVESLTGDLTGIVTVNVTITDAFDLTSETLSATIEAGTFAADGEACGGLAICDPATLECGDAGTCVAAP